VVDAYTLGAPDSSQRQVLLKVSDELRIVNLLNYPNPFARGTEFTFSLAGPRAPDQAVLRIYTIAGRKIHEIGLGAGDTRIGFNRIEWDGRDSDGDEIANGIYLYKLEIRLGESSVAELGKLAKLR
jgi:flagellar hook assembly protein FlgD